MTSPVGQTVLFDGVLDQFTVHSDQPDREFEADCLDAWGRPGAERLSTALYASVRTGDAINIILDGIGWAGARDIDPGATVMRWWWTEDEDAATAVQKIVDSEGPPAIAYVEGGTFIYRDRHHRVLDSRSVTSQAIFTHAIPGGSGPPGSFKVLKGFTYDHGLRSIINRVSFTVEQRELPGELTEVWKSESTYGLTNGETVLIDAQASDPFLGAVLPVQGVDYTLEVGVVEVRLSRTSGQSTVISVLAVGGPARMVGLRLRAQPVPVAGTIKVSDEDSTSIAKYGVYTWQGEAPWAGVYDAKAIASKIIATWSVNRPSVTLSIANINSAYLGQILTGKLSDRITVINDELGLDDDFYIEQIEHRIRKLGAVHTVTYGCLKVGPEQPANVFILGTSNGVLGVNVLAAFEVDDAATIFRLDSGILGTHVLGH